MFLLSSPSVRDQIGSPLSLEEFSDKYSGTANSINESISRIIIKSYEISEFTLLK